MGEATPLRYWLELDALTEDRAIYTGPNNMAATIDRALFNSEGKPIRVVIVVSDLDPCAEDGEGQ